MSHRHWLGEESARLARLFAGSEAALARLQPEVSFVCQLCELHPDRRAE